MEQVEKSGELNCPNLFHARSIQKKKKIFNPDREYRFGGQCYDLV